MAILNFIIVPFLFALLLALFITPLIIKFANATGIVDDPKKNKHPKVIHTYPVPRGGGLVIFLAISVSTLLFLPLDKHLVGILIGALILTVLGIIDDKYNLNPYVRLIIQFVAASAPVFAGIGIAFINNPLGHGIIDLSHPQINFEFFGKHSIWLISDLFAVFWIVTLIFSSEAIVLTSRSSTATP